MGMRASARNAEVVKDVCRTMNAEGLPLIAADPLTCPLSAVCTGTKWSPATNSIPSSYESDTRPA